MGITQWIADLLPTGKLYCEPFAGMCGVLLSRPPIKREIVNDLNSDLINWWQVVRDSPGELIERLRHTPRSEQEFAEIKEADWDAQTPVWRAWAYTTILSNCFASVPTPQLASYGTQYGGKISGASMPPSRLPKQIELLAQRMIDVEIRHTDGIKLLHKLADVREAVVYCDPPYYTTAIDAYDTGIDIEGLTEALAAQKGAVAISGYGEEWDHMGWNRAVRRRPAKHSKTHNAQEVLWANFALPRNLFEVE